MKKFLSILIVSLILISLILVPVDAASLSPNDSIQTANVQADTDLDMLGWLEGIFNSLGSSGLLGTISDSLEDIFKRLSKINDAITDGVVSSITNGFNGLWTYLDAFQNRLNSIFSLLQNAIPYAISNGFNGVYDYLSDTYEKLNSIASLITNHVVDSIVNGITGTVLYLSDIYQKIHDMYNVITLGINSVLSDIFSSLVNLPSNIVEGFKGLFYIDVDELELIFTDFISELSSKFGVSTVSSVSLFDEGRSSSNSELDKIVDIFSVEKEPGNISTEYYIRGLGKSSYTFVNYHYLISSVNFFRPFIRAFLFILLLFFHYSQIMSLIKQERTFGKGAIKLVSNGG